MFDDVKTEPGGCLTFCTGCRLMWHEAGGLFLADVPFQPGTNESFNSPEPKKKNGGGGGGRRDRRTNQTHGKADRRFFMPAPPRHSIIDRMTFPSWVFRQSVLQSEWNPQSYPSTVGLCNKKRQGQPRVLQWLIEVIRVKSILVKLNLTNTFSSDSGFIIIAMTLSKKCKRFFEHNRNVRSIIVDFCNRKIINVEIFIGSKLKLYNLEWRCVSVVNGYTSQHFTL